MTALKTAKTIPAIRAEIGIVMIHAQIMFIVRPHLTADNRFVKPTPIMEPVVVCVVETGMPKCSVKNNVKAAAVSALTPSSGVILVIRDPMVFTIFHPPDMVPSAIAE